MKSSQEKEQADDPATDHSWVVLIFPHEIEGAGGAQGNPQEPCGRWNNCFPGIPRRPEASVLNDTTTGCHDGKQGTSEPDKNKNKREKVCVSHELKVRPQQELQRRSWSAVSAPDADHANDAARICKPRGDSGVRARSRRSAGAREASALREGEDNPDGRLPSSSTNRVRGSRSHLIIR